MKQPLPIEFVERIFQRLHGRFGSRFTDNFKSGELDDQDRDTGIESAKQVWAEELSGLSAARLKAGLSAHYDYPPSCDQFKANCKQTVHPPITNALPRKFTQEEKQANHQKLQTMLKKLNIKSMAAH